MKRYIGATIGPIKETLGYAKKTKDLWSASYLFSYIMREAIKRIKHISNDIFIVPFTEKDEIFESKKGVGLFHDRFIIQLEEGSKLSLKKIHNEYEEVIKLLAQELTNNPKNQNNIKKYLMAYINFHVIEMEINEGENPILKINNALDCVELHKQYVAQTEENAFSMAEYLSKPMKGIDKAFFLKDGFIQGPNFPSLMHIALDTLDEISEEKKTIKSIIDKWLNNDNYNEHQEEDAYKEIEKLYRAKKLELDYKGTYKYVAIVHVDGDKVGSLISCLLQDNELNIDQTKLFSEALMKYALDAKEEISRLGGVPIYAGGDDLLFFAPVHKVLELVMRIKNLFNKHFLYIKNNESYKQIELSLSFGISIQYYKYPLREALEASRDQLFKKAKNYRNATSNKKKEAIGIRVLKHSGQYFEICTGLESESYKKLLEMLKEEYSNETLKAVQYKLRQDEIVLLEILNGIGNNIIGEDRLVAYFNNNFNEEVHKERGEKKLEDIRELMLFIYKEHVIEHEEDKRNILKHIFAYLQFIRFMQGGMSLDE